MFACLPFEKLWTSQRTLRRAAQIPALMQLIEDGESLPPIEIVEDADGQLIVTNGHHRLTAYWLAGNRHLSPEHYVMLYQDSPRTGPLMSWEDFHSSLDAFLPPL